MSEQTETLAYQRTNVYEAADEALKREIFSFAEGYKTFLDLAKTEREACAEVIKEAEAQGCSIYIRKKAPLRRQGILQ